MSRRALAYLELLRAGTLLSPAADVVAGLCVAGVPWSLAAGRAVLASACLYAAGMVLNDHADRALDAVHRPERPIPGGRIAPRSALQLGLCLLAVAIALSPWPGYHAGLGVLVLAYDYGVKSSALAGALTMGALRALNLCAGAAALAPELPPALLAAAAAYAGYIVAVTLLGILEDHRDVRPRAVVSLQLVPPLCATLACVQLPYPWRCTPLALALGLALVLRARTVRIWDQRAIRASMTWLLLGTTAYDALLCLGAGRALEAAVVALAIPAARWVSRRIALT